VVRVPDTAVDIVIRSRAVLLACSCCCSAAHAAASRSHYIPGVCDAQCHGTAAPHAEHWTHALYVEHTALWLFKAALLVTETATESLPQSTVAVELLPCV
jgi:hypothetical protein